MWFELNNFVFLYICISLYVCTDVLLYVSFPRLYGEMPVISSVTRTFDKELREWIICHLIDNFQLFWWFSVFFPSILFCIFAFFACISFSLPMRSVDSISLQNHREQCAPRPIIIISFNVFTVSLSYLYAIIGTNVWMIKRNTFNMQSNNRCGLWTLEVKWGQEHVRIRELREKNKRQLLSM